VMLNRGYYWLILALSIPAFTILLALVMAPCLSRAASPFSWKVCFQSRTESSAWSSAMLQTGILQRTSAECLDESLPVDVLAGGTLALQHTLWWRIHMFFCSINRDFRSKKYEHFRSCGEIGGEFE